MKRRGSAYIYVLLMILAITIVGMAVSDASMNFILTQRRRENATRADIVLTGAVEAFDAERLATRVELPHNTSVTIDGITTSIAASDFTKAPGTIKVVATCTYRERTYTKTAYLAKDRFSPFQYAIATGDKVDTSQTISTGLLGANGHIFGKNEVSLRSILNTINGDVDTPYHTVRGVVTGRIYTQQGEIHFPKPKQADYLSVATTVHGGDLTVNGYTFSAVAPGAPYPVITVNGNLTIRGTISGVGTIYVKGNVTISGAMSYANNDSRIAIVSGGSITIGGFNCVGYLYAEGNITVNGLLGNLPRGGLMALGQIDFSRGMTITHDPAVTNDLNEGVRMRLPAYWP